MEGIEWVIPTIPNDPNPVKLVVKNGFQLFLVGPNGSGKSALIHRFVSQNTNRKIKRITAHRQTWFDSGSIDLTPASRQQYDRDTRNYDTRDEARWKDLRGRGGLSAVLFDLVAKENAINKSIARHVRNGDNSQASKIAQESSSPFDRINELLVQGRLTVTVASSNDENLLASHPQGESFSVAEMSDGERNAMIIAAHVITAEPGTVFVIDEPERHLHRSIIQPFLSALFAERRTDCAFIVATHEIALAVASPAARVLMLRSCQWVGRQCQAWDAQVLEPDTELPEDLKHAILGSRKKILFVEGKTSSNDFSLYTALFPSISVIPMGSCEEVRRAVAGLRGSYHLHQVEGFGLIDRDNRTEEDVKKLAQEGVFALEVHSVEALYYCSDAIAAVAHRQANSLGHDASKLAKAAKKNAIHALNVEPDHTAERMASHRCERKIHEKILSEIPDLRSIIEDPTRPFYVSIDPMPYSDELKHFNNLVEVSELDELIARYPLRKTRCFEVVATTLRCRDQKDYELMVCAQIKRDNSLAEKLKQRIAPLSKLLEQEERPNPNN